MNLVLLVLYLVPLLIAFALVPTPTFFVVEVFTRV